MDEHVLIHRRSLFSTKAPMKTRTIDSKKIIVASTRTGLNIYGDDGMNQCFCQLILRVYYRFDLPSELDVATVERR